MVICDTAVDGVTLNRILHHYCRKSTGVTDNANNATCTIEGLGTSTLKKESNHN